MRISLQTHHRVQDTGAAVRKVVDAVTAAGGEVLVTPAEAQKHGLDDGFPGRHEHRD